MAQWDKKSFKLKKNHHWEATPGYNVFVADRGAVRFNFPDTWTVIPGEDSIKLYDKPPPDDDCVLQVSVFHLPPSVDWSGLPVAQLLSQVIQTNDKSVVSQGRIHQVRRGDMDLAWVESRFIDANEHREAYTRCCLARGANVQPCITLDFWPEHHERLEPVWEEILRSLRLGDYIKDPARGARPRRFG